MQLIVETSDKFPFAREEVKEIALEVIPKNIKEDPKAIITITDEPSYVGEGIELQKSIAEVRTIQHKRKEYIIVLSNYPKALIRFSKERPFTQGHTEESLAKGYNTLEEYENGREILAHTLAHEFKHISQLEYEYDWDKMKSGGPSNKYLEQDAERYADKVLRENIRGLLDKEKG